MRREITDMTTWLIDNENRIFRYTIYRRMFTPYEESQKYIDETEYENGGNYTLCRIEEAVDLGNGEWLLGMREIIDEDLSNTITYVRLGEIRLEYFECDQDIFSKSQEEYGCEDEL